MINRLKISLFVIFQVIFTFFVLKYTFEMQILKESTESLIQGVNNNEFSNLMTGYLPEIMMTNVYYVLSFILIVILISNVSLFNGFKKLGFLSIILASGFIAYLTIYSNDEKAYIKEAKSNFDLVYQATASIAEGTDKALIDNAKIYSDRYSSMPNNLNKIKFITAYQTLAIKMEELRSLNIEHIPKFNEVLKNHVSYVDYQERILHATQFYLVGNLILLAMIRIRIGKK